MRTNHSAFPKVYIIVLNWNGWKDTIECLESVYNNCYRNYQVVVVDNNSENDSVNKIKLWANNKISMDIAKENAVYSKYSKIVNKPIPLIEYNYNDAINGGNVHKEMDICQKLLGNYKYPLVIIHSGRNLGFSDGNNIGIKYALSKGDLDYVWILNNDTVIDKNALEEMVKLAESNKKIGMVGSKLLYYYNQDTIQEVYGEVNWKDNGKGIGTGEQDDGQWDRNIEVKGRIMGASILVKNQVIHQIGILDDNYFMEYEDADWCMRAIRAGWKIFYCYKSKIWHKEGGTITGNNKIKKRFLLRSVNLETLSRFIILRYYGIRNSIYFINKFYKKQLILFLLIMIPQKLVKSFIKALLCKKNRIKCIKLSFKSVYDGVKQNMGKNIDPQTGRYILTNKSKSSVLFVHNTIAHYREEFFKLLGEKVNTKYVFTKINKAQTIYNVNGNINFTNKSNIIILKNYFKMALGLIPVLIKEDYDVVIAPAMDNIVECLEGIITIIIAKIRGKKVLYFWEKWSVPEECMPLKRKIKIKLKDIVVKPFIKCTDLCIAPGKKSYEYFVKCGVSTEKICIAPDASIVNKSIEYENIRLKYKISNDKRIILYYGRIIKRKGLDVLIKAFKKVDSHNCYLLVCGDGEFKNCCESLANELNIENICFTGFIDPKKRDIFFSQCDVFVLPSCFYGGEGEPWGLTINEAMQFGKPVIATTAVGSAFDLIQNEVNGYMVEQNNENELYNALSKVLCNNESEVMGEKSREIINNGYTYNDMVNGFIKAINFSMKDTRYYNK